jgi:hypothetical protein
MNKRALDADGFAVPMLSAKKMRANDDDDNDYNNDDNNERQQFDDDINELVDNAPEVPALDESGLKKALLSFEKKVLFFWFRFPFYSLLVR